jgi:hypothetical protein
MLRRFLSRAGAVLFLVYVLEAGAFLLMSPWSRFWDRRVASRSPVALQPFLYSPFLRGFISGVGLLHLFAAVRQVEAWRRKNEA